MVLPFNLKNVRGRVDPSLKGYIEVDSVGEDEPCETVDGAFWYKVLYPVLRLVCYPVVDRDPRLLRRLREIQWSHAGPIVLREQSEVRFQEFVVFLSPYGVGDVQLEVLAVLALRLCSAGCELATELVEREMQPALGEIKAESFGHLALSLTSRTGVCHGKSERDAVGRVEQVVVRTGQSMVEIERKGGIAIN